MSGCEGCERRKAWLKKHPREVAIGVVALGLLIGLAKARGPKEEKEGS
jgi:hypothetical protein